MRKILIAALLATTAIVLPEAAHAGPVGGLIGAIGGAISAATSAITAGGIFGAALRIGAGVLLNRLLTPGQQSVTQDVVKQELTQETSQPAYRFVYGHTRATATPVPWYSLGDYLYGMLLVNSRPSEIGTWSLYVDARTCEVEDDQDEYDFSGPGIGLTPEGGTPVDGEPIIRMWIGDGTHTAPPTAFSSIDYFETTDIWEGRTVLFLKCLKGENMTANYRRWPNNEPVIELEADFSKIWDPRDELQDPDDETTWTFTDNQGLIALDASRTNPIAQYSLSEILLASFIEAADVADELVQKKDLSYENRYRAAGTIIWNENSEIGDQLQPIADAGAGRYSSSAGRLAYASGVYRPSIYTATDFLIDGQFEFRTRRQERDLPKAIRTKYTEPLLNYETYEVPMIGVKGAAPEETDRATNLDLTALCQWATQAMRVQQIKARELEAEKALAFTLPAPSLVLIPGSICTTAMANTAWSRIDGEWMVETTDPVLIPVYDEELSSVEGQTFRNPVELSEYSSTIFDWDKDTDEFDMTFEEIDEDELQLIQPGGAISVSTGYVNTGGAQVPRVTFDFDPSPSSVSGYLWEYAIGDDTSTDPSSFVWVTGGWLDSDTRDGDGDVFGYFDVPGIFETYGLRVRANGAGVSDYVYYDNIIFGFDLTVNTYSSTTGQVDFNITAPDSDVLSHVDLRNVSTGGDLADATTLGSFSADPGETIDISDTVASGTSDYYLIPITLTGQDGPAEGPYSLTT